MAERQDTLRHHRMMAAASVTWHGVEPVFYALGAELDWMEGLPAPLSDTEGKRLAFLRRLRAGGAVVLAP